MMTMSEPVLCCDTCFEAIACHSADAAKLWIDLCGIKGVWGDVFGIPSNDCGVIKSSYLRLLETMKFITTTENLDVILIKVHGMQNDASGVYFCIGKCDE
jgi:hypothetical protein